MKFKIHQTDQLSNARCGTISTERGIIDTPVFMPVGTAGTVKGVHINELKNEIRAPIILGNTYHLYLRPGTDVLEEAGGLHKFISWDKNILTDSGGYQVYSLSSNRKIKEEGVTFQSHIDGSKHTLSPEKTIDIQRSIGGDFIMAFDECTPYPCDRQYVKNSMELTHRWWIRCQSRFIESKDKYQHHQTLIPIVQGGTYPELRRESAKFVGETDAHAYAIGGLSVGEPQNEMYDMTSVVCEILPFGKPRYLMGVGTPQNLLECISRGIDMFDCVMPTRNARHGMLFTKNGIINIKNEKWKRDFSPIDNESNCSTSQYHTKAYLRHLILSKEMLGAQIASIHNLSFYLWLVSEAKNQIMKGSFTSWKNSMYESIGKRI